MATSIGDMAVNIVARVDKFGANLKVAANQVSNFQRDVNRTTGGGFLGGVVPVFDLVGAFRLAAGAAERVVGFVKEVAQRVDEAADRAQQLGTTFNKLAGLNFAATISGSGPEQISQGLTAMLRNINAVGEESKRTAQAMDLLGLNIEKLRSKDPVDAFSDIAEAIKNLDKRSDRVAATLAIFGKSGLGMLPVLEQGAAGIRKLDMEARGLGANLDDQVIQSLSNTQDAVTRLDLAVQGFLNRAAGFAGAGFLNNLAKVFAGWNAIIDARSFDPIEIAATAMKNWAQSVPRQAENFDQSVESVVGNFEKLEELQRRAQQIFGATRTPRERFEQTEKELLELRDTIDQLTGKPLIDAPTFSRAMKAAREELRKAEQGGISDLLSAGSFRQVELARTDLTGLATVLANRKQQVHDPQLAQTNANLQKINNTLEVLHVAGVAA